MNCENDKYFNHQALIDAKMGILSPQPTVIDIGQIIYRFGSDVLNAKSRSWWLDANQYSSVRTWAALSGLTIPHAARVLCAVAHEWGKGAPSHANMLVLASATVRKPLRAYQGLTAPQLVLAGGKTAEFFDMPLMSPLARILQLYIPGLHDSAVASASLVFGSVQHFKEGDSHIGGVPGFPKGAIIQ